MSFRWRFSFGQSVNIIQRRNQERRGRNQSHHNQQQRLSRQCSAVLLILHAICSFGGSVIFFHIIQSIIVSFINFLCCHLNQVSRLIAQQSVAQQALSCHRIACRVSLSNHGHHGSGCLSSEFSGKHGSHSRAQLKDRHSDNQECKVRSRGSSFQAEVRVSDQRPHRHWISGWWLSAHRHVQVGPRSPWRSVMEQSSWRWSALCEELSSAHLQCQLISSLPQRKRGFTSSCQSQSSSHSGHSNGSDHLKSATMSQEGPHITTSCSSIVFQMPLELPQVSTRFRSQ